MLEPLPMASGPWTTRRVFEFGFGGARRCAGQHALWLCALWAGLLGADAARAQLQTQTQPKAQASAPSAPTCAKPLYLTFDTGHMEVAPLVAQVLQRQKLRVTFFAANERSKGGDGSLGQSWAPWWKARAAEGHEFASHTMDHMVWVADLAPAKGGAARFRMRPTAGAAAGRPVELDAAGYCEQLNLATRTLENFTGQRALPLFRAAAGRTSPKLLEAARACGYEHVGWSPTGFLGDESPSEKISNKQLLAQSLKNIKDGDILLAHLGIWSRKDPWAPAVLEPLIVGLKERGFCFATLSEHPDYRDWIARHRR